MHLSVTIATRNRAGLLDRTLQSLGRQSYPREQFEVVVCDHGSTDETAAVCAEHSNRLSLRAVGLPFTGFDVAGPKRRAVAEAAGRIVLVLDCGVICPPGFLAAHVAAHADGGAMICGPALGWENEEESAFWLGLDPERPPAYSDVPKEFADARDQLVGAFPCCPWMLLWGSNFSAAAAAVAAVGSFDPRLTGWGWDDLELGYRLHRHGLQYRYVPDAWCLHYPHPRAPLGVRLAQARANWEYAYAKHRVPELELWDVSEYGDYDRTFRMVRDALVGVREELPAAHIFSPDSVFFGFDTDSVAHSICLPADQRTPGAIQSFGIRTPFLAGQFERAVISPFWTRLLFAGSPGRPPVAQYVISEASRVAGRVEAWGCSRVPERLHPIYQRMRKSVATDRIAPDVIWFE